ncbi:MAG: glucose-1-phosphate cytidylyltransferase [Pseudomonadota bacterium]
MKAVILAGGLGTRLSEETDRIPKPMVTLDDKPILWHIMKIYAKHGIEEFIICAGYKAQSIIEYFANYPLHTSNVTIDLANNHIEHLTRRAEPWKVTIIDTGENTQTGGRLRRVQEYLTPGEDFCLTYGDGVADIDITASIAFHKKHGFDATMTAVKPPARFGAAVIEGNTVVKFSEKPTTGEGYINGGFFVMNHEIFNHIEGDSIMLERQPMEALTSKRTLGAYTHDGFWHPMDTLRDRRYLQDLLANKQAPWKWW